MFTTANASVPGLDAAPRVLRDVGLIRRELGDDRLPGPRARQAATTRCDISGSLPKRTPPSRTFGQEMLISTASTGVSSNRRASSAYSSMVDPDRFAKNRVSVKSRAGRISSMTAREPGFCRPMELSIPAGVSQTRWGAFPSLGSSVVPFRQTAPAVPIREPLDPRILLAEAHAPGEQNERGIESHPAELDLQSLPVTRVQGHVPRRPLPAGNPPETRATLYGCAPIPGAPCTC